MRPAAGAAGRSSRVIAPILGISLWIGFVGSVCWYDSHRHDVAAGDRALVDRLQGRLAGEFGTDSETMRRYVFPVVTRGRKTMCVAFMPYRKSDGGGRYCYRRSDGRLIEERMSLVSFGRRSTREIIEDWVRRD
jgi:hypothetical protein